MLLPRWTISPTTFGRPFLSATTTDSPFCETSDFFRQLDFPFPTLLWLLALLNLTELFPPRSFTSPLRSAYLFAPQRPDRPTVHLHFQSSNTHLHLPALAVIFYNRSSRSPWLSTLHTTGFDPSSNGNLKISTFSASFLLTHYNECYACMTAIQNINNTSH